MDGCCTGRSYGRLLSAPPDVVAEAERDAAAHCGGDGELQRVHR